MPSLDRFRAALRSMDGTVLALASPTILSIVSELRRADVSDQRLRALQRPGKQAASGRPTLTPSAKSGKFVAVVPMHGTAFYDLEFQPFAFATMHLARVVSQLAADPSIETIVLDIDSPGGQVTGTQEAADAVWKARQKKDVFGIVNPLCASAGYWIGSQCTSLTGVPSADVGSIGVFMCHFDLSGMLAEAGVKPTFIYAGENKIEGNSMEPLSAGAKQFFQTEVNKTYADFVAAVARGRGTSISTVKATFGAGRCFSARDALRVGMIDAIEGSPDAAMHRVVSGTPASRKTPSATAGYRTVIADEAVKNPPRGDRYRAILSAEARK